MNGHGIDLQASLPTSDARRGSILLWVLGLNVVIFLYLMGSFPFFQTVVRVPARSYLTDQALALAESGLAHGLWQVNNGGGNYPNPPWTPYTQPSSPPECFGATTCYSRDVNLTAGDPSNKPVGVYRIFVAVNPTINSGHPVLTATGSAPMTSPTATKILRALLAPPAASTTFRYGAFGKDRARFGLDPTDSVQISGNIGTNAAGTYDPDLDIGASATVTGDLYTVAGAQLAYDPADLNGTVVTLATPEPFPQIVNPASCVDTSCGCDVVKPPISLSCPSGSCETYTVPANTIVCTTSVSISQSANLRIEAGGKLYVQPSTAGSAAIMVSGSGMILAKDEVSETQPAQIFVKNGYIDSGGSYGLVNGGWNDGNPAAFQLFVTSAGTTDGVVLRTQSAGGAGGGAIRAVIYAPDNAIRLIDTSDKTNTIYGALIGREVLMDHDSFITYASEVSKVRLNGGGSTPSGTYEISAWVEN